MSCFFHKLQPNESDYEPAQIDKDFENVISLLKNSMYNIEMGRESFELGDKQNLEDTLNINTMTPQLHPSDILTIPYSGVPLLNLTEFLI